jgi:hypothetical protein
MPVRSYLASVFRTCLEFTWAFAVSTCHLAHLLDPALAEVPARDAAERCPDLLRAFLARIDLACSLRDFGNCARRTRGSRKAVDGAPALQEQSQNSPPQTRSWSSSQTPISVPSSNSAGTACFDHKSLVRKASRLTLPKSFSEGPNSKVRRNAWVTEEGNAGRLTYSEFRSLNR